jgi:LAO/AO transport system kinase
MRPIEAGSLLSSVDTLLERFRAGHRGALARLLTYVENENPIADEILGAIFQSTGRAHIIGVTGPPGAGKSTLTNALIQAYRETGRTVGVIAIDPSSALTGGATLGDRIRMLETFDDDGVFVRSMATRGHRGGLSFAAGRCVHVMDAFGFNMIVLETVGVGQDEVDVAGTADTTLLLQVPGLGDSIQTIKAGILEIADIIVVNKSDLAGARELVRDLKAMLRFRDHPAWLPPVVETASTTGAGIDRLIEEIDRHSAYLEESGEALRRSERRTMEEIQGIARRDLHGHLERALLDPAGVSLVAEVLARRVTPRRAAEQLVEHVGVSVSGGSAAEDGP